MILRGTAVRMAMGALALGFAMQMTPILHAQGEAVKIYKDKCAGCHGPDGSANTPAGKALKTRDFHSPDVKNESDADFATIITKGKNKMPAFEGKLKEAEIKSLVAYVRDLANK